MDNRTTGWTTERRMKDVRGVQVIRRGREFTGHGVDLFDKGGDVHFFADNPHFILAKKSKTIVSRTGGQTANKTHCNTVKHGETHCNTIKHIATR